MEADPMSLIIASFTKVAKDNEGLALQILVRPAGDVFAKRFGEMLEDLRKGETLKRAIDRQSLLKESLHMIGDMFSGAKTKEEIEEEKKKKLTHVDENATKLLQEKLGKTIVETNIRIISSADSLPRTQAIRGDLEAAFSQFAEVNGNSIKWEEVEGRKQKALLHRFSYRLGMKKKVTRSTSQSLRRCSIFLCRQRILLMSVNRRILSLLRQQIFVLKG
jgi:hypothetical protein